MDTRSPDRGPKPPSDLLLDLGEPALGEAHGIEDLRQAVGQLTVKDLHLTWVLKARTICLLMCMVDLLKDLLLQLLAQDLPI